MNTENKLTEELVTVTVPRKHLERFAELCAAIMSPDHQETGRIVRAALAQSLQPVVSEGPQRYTVQYVDLPSGEFGKSTVWLRKSPANGEASIAVPGNTQFVKAAYLNSLEAELLRLRCEVKAVEGERRALTRASAFIDRLYAGGPDCDCTMDGGVHTCGWPELLGLRNQCHAALRPSPSVEAETAGELQRYGIKWQGENMPICVPMPDGYWTPWHLANARPPLRDEVKEDPRLVEAREIIENLKAMVKTVPEFHHQKYDSFDARVNKFLSETDARLSRSPKAEKDGDARRQAVIDAAILWAYCPEAASYKEGPSIEDTCEQLSEAVSRLTEVPNVDLEWWTVEEMRAAIGPLLAPYQKERAR